MVLFLNGLVPYNLVSVCLLFKGKHCEVENLDEECSRLRKKFQKSRKREAPIAPWEAIYVAKIERFAQLQERDRQGALNGEELAERNRYCKHCITPLDSTNTGVIHKGG